MKIKKFAIATDTHFNLISDEKFDLFIKETKHLKEEIDFLIFSGDISEYSWEEKLKKIAKKTEIPIYFILGNHDYYGSSITRTNERLKKYSETKLLQEPVWLSDVEGVDCGSFMLIGHENWWDGGYTNQYTTWLDNAIMFQDYSLIKEISEKTIEERFLELTKQAQLSTNEIIRKLKNAFKTHDNVILITHVPPFKENCTHFGIQMTQNWLSHFSCRVLGDALTFVMQNEPEEKSLVVFSGHTHEETLYEPLKNLKSLTTKAKLFKPKAHVQQVKKLFK